MPRHQPAPANPWGLTCSEYRTVSAMVERGVMQAVADDLSLGIQTIKSQTVAAREKMGVTNAVQMAVTFDRWHRGLES